MMIRSLLTIGMSILLASGYCAHLEEQTPNPKNVQVVPVEATRDPDWVTTKIIFPKYGELKTSNPVKGQILVDGYAIGVDTDQPRKKEIWNDPEGQSLHIIIDNQPYFSVNEALIDALDDVQDYFEQTAEFEVPFRLQPGMHVIRAFPVRSYNESVKSDKAFAASVFYFQEKKDNSQIDLKKPYLTYNEPQGEYDYGGKNPQPVLLDFYVTNCALSMDGYKVRLTIDNDHERTLTSWQPYYVYGLSKGQHKFRLELLDPQNKPVPGLFNDTTRTIVLK